MTENEVLKDLQNYQGILKAKTRINAGVNPEIALNAITEAIDVIQAYRAIGTVEECRAAMEKQRAKRPSDYQIDDEYDSGYCPCCGKAVYDDGGGYCPYCGQMLEWDEEE